MHYLLNHIPALAIGFIVGAVAMTWFIVGVLEFIDTIKKHTEP